MSKPKQRKRDRPITSDDLLRVMAKLALIMNTVPDGKRKYLKHYMRAEREFKTLKEQEDALARAERLFHHMREGGEKAILPSHLALSSKVGPDP